MSITSIEIYQRLKENPYVPRNKGTKVSYQGIKLNGKYQFSPELMHFIGQNVQVVPCTSEILIFTKDGKFICRMSIVTSRQ